MSTYVANQTVLASTPAGKLAASMQPGDRFVMENGEIATVWKAWRPDLDGSTEAYAAQYRRPLDIRNHNTEIGITVNPIHGGYRTLHVPVSACGLGPGLSAQTR